MKRAIYSLAALPFIAFGVKTVADEGAVYPISLTLADVMAAPAQADMDMTVQKFINPQDYKTYMTFPPEKKVLVYQAIMNAPAGQEQMRASTVIQALQFERMQQSQNQPMQGGEPQSIMFEDSNETSPAQNAASTQQPQSGTPAALADMMQTPQSGTPASNAAAQQDDNSNDNGPDQQPSGW